jgi:hypothetical protein
MNNRKIVMVPAAVCREVLYGALPMTAWSPLSHD